jgi:hypothetical protein
VSTPCHHCSNTRASTVISIPTSACAQLHPFLRCSSACTATTASNSAKALNLTPLLLIHIHPLLPALHMHNSKRPQHSHSQHCGHHITTVHRPSPPPQLPPSTHTRTHTHTRARAHTHTHAHTHTRTHARAHTRTSLLRSLFTLDYARSSHVRSTALLSLEGWRQE